MNTKYRSLVLGATLCGAWMWTGPAQAQLVGGALGGGVSGSLMGGPGPAVGGDLRMDATGSLRANPGELRTTAAEARRDAVERTRAARERGSAAGRRAVETARSTPTPVLETNSVIETDVAGQVDASQRSTDDEPAKGDRKTKDAPSSDARKRGDQADSRREVVR